MTLEQADAMIATARAHDRLMVANLMQRYNPVYDAVARLVESRALGEVLHGTFENYASDENLAPEHWFWDRSKSGGIFIEHGVHFFDLFTGWLGPGEVVSAQVGVRPGSSPPIEEHVQCAARYAPDILVNFYHGFHQTGRMDRQELRIVCERGDVTLYDWVPTRARVHAIADEAQTRALCEIFPGARLDVSASYVPKDRACRGRHKAIDAYQTIELSWGDGVNKSHRYGELLRALMADQVAWIRDRSHRRKIDESHGRDSLAMAVAADRMRGAECTPGSPLPPASDREQVLQPGDRPGAELSGRLGGAGQSTPDLVVGERLEMPEGDHGLLVLRQPHQGLADGHDVLPGDRQRARRRVGVNGVPSEVNGIRAGLQRPLAFRQPLGGVAIPPDQVPQIVPQDTADPDAQVLGIRPLELREAAMHLQQRLLHDVGPVALAPKTGRQLALRDGQQVRL